MTLPDVLPAGVVRFVALDANARYLPFPEMAG